MRSRTGLDLNDIHAHAAKSKGVKVAISTDAHSVNAFQYMRFGIDQARRGWLTADDVINTRSLARIAQAFEAVKALACGRPSFNRVCGNAADAQGPEQLTRGRHGAVDVDAAAGILDHDRLETLALRIFRRIAHAEIEGEAGEKRPA